MGSSDGGGGHVVVANGDEDDDDVEEDDGGGQRDEMEPKGKRPERRVSIKSPSTKPAPAVLQAAALRLPIGVGTKKFRAGALLGPRRGECGSERPSVPIALKLGGVGLRGPGAATASIAAYRWMNGGGGGGGDDSLSKLSCFVSLLRFTSIVVGFSSSSDFGHAPPRCGLIPFVHGRNGGDTKRGEGVDVRNSHTLANTCFGFVF